MKYKIKVTGDKNELMDFVDYYNQNDFKKFKAKGHTLNSIKSIIRNSDYSMGMRTVSSVSDSMVVITGSAFSEEAGIDSELILGMSKLFPKLYFEARAFCSKNMQVLGAEAFNGYIRNPFVYESLGDLLEVFFTYMCSQRFFDVPSARIKSSGGYIGTFELLKEQTCCVTESIVKHYGFYFENGVAFNVELRLGSELVKNVSFNVFRMNVKKDLIQDEFDVFSNFLMDNLSAGFLNSQNSNKIKRIMAI